MSTPVGSAADLRRAVLVSVVVVGLASTSLGLVTWAYFSDADASGQNAVQGGVLDLAIDGADVATSSFSIVDGGPGAATEHAFAITNRGTVPADHVAVSIGYTENDSAAEPADGALAVELNATETASLINVTAFEYRDHRGNVVRDVLANASDGNGNGIVDLQDLRTQRGTVDDLPPPGTDGTEATSLVVGVEIANDDDPAFTTGGNRGGNLTGQDEDVMADGIDITITVTLNQDAGQ